MDQAPETRSIGIPNTDLTHEEAENRLVELAKLLAKFIGDDFKIDYAMEFGPDLLPSAYPGRIAAQTGRSSEEIQRLLDQALLLPTYLKFLTPPLTRLLVRNFNRIFLWKIQRISDEVAEILSEFSGDELNLCGLLDVPPHQLQCIGASSVSVLDLSGLKKLNLKQAEALDVPRDTLILNGLGSLTPDAAAPISRNKQRLYLRGLKEIAPETSAALVANSNLAEAELSVGTGKSLGAENARELFQWRGALNLCGLESITVNEAVLLANGQTRTLCFPSIRHLAADTALALSRFPGRIEFSSLEEMSDDAFRNLVSGQARLELRGLRELTDSQTESICNHAHEIVLGGLSELSDSQVMRLRSRSTPVNLDYKVHLSETMKNFLKNNGTGSLHFWGENGQPLWRVGLSESNEK